MSHAPSDGRQTLPAEANEHWSVQQADDAGSHTALALNLQVLRSQQASLPFAPGSQSSPGSTIPFPHC